MTDINEIKKQVFIIKCPFCKSDQVLPWENNPRNPFFGGKYAYIKCKNPKCGVDGIDVRGRHTEVIKDKVKKK